MCEIVSRSLAEAKPVEGIRSSVSPSASRPASRAPFSNGPVIRRSPEIVVS